MLHSEYARYARRLIPENGREPGVRVTGLECPESGSRMVEDSSVVDVFCGVGGLTHGFVLEGFRVVAGIDADKACEYAYEKNNCGSKFINKRVEDVTAAEILALFPEGHIKILVGCAPCQPYSPYTKKRRDSGQRWRLFAKFARLVCDVKPDLVSMENVPELATSRNGRLYRGVLNRLRREGYCVSEYRHIYCPDYGIPQQRTRLVVFASRYGEVQIAPSTHTPDDYVGVRQAIGHLSPLKAGEGDGEDRLHKAARLSELNLKRIRASVPGGTWRDWPQELVAQCHRKETGKGYASVYGRMAWDEPAPTLTAQCYGFGNGRFGHPEQDRAISLREAALLQTFPRDYEFLAAGDPVPFKALGRLIGNAVPVDLGRVIAKSIRAHLEAQSID